MNRRRAVIVLAVLLVLGVVTSTFPTLRGLFILSRVERLPFQIHPQTGEAQVYCQLGRAEIGGPFRASLVIPLSLCSVHPVGFTAYVFHTAVRSIFSRDLCQPRVPS